MFASMALLRALRRPSMLLVAGVAAHNYLKRRGPVRAAPPPPLPPPPRHQDVPASNGNGRSPATDVNVVVDDLLSR